MLPAHTQILFNMLQDAYRVKAKERIMPAPRNGQIDFLALLAAFTSATTSRIEIVNSTNRIETTTIATTQGNLIIPAQDIQLEKLFPQARKRKSQSENFTTEGISENLTTQTPFDYSYTTEDEQSTDILTSTITLSVDDDNSTMIMDETTNSTDSIDTSEITSSPFPTTVPTNHSHLLHKLCQRILSHIVPNISSSINSSSILSNTANETLNALLSWLTNYHNSTKHSMTTSTTTLPSFVVEDISSSSESLQRIDLDDISHQMENYTDDETIPH